MSTNSTAAKNLTFKLLTNGDVIYSFENLNFLIRHNEELADRLWRKERAGIKTDFPLPILPNLIVFEPTPSPNSSEYFKKHNVPVISLVSDSNETGKLEFRTDYEPFTLHSSPENGTLLLYVLAGSRDLTKLKIAAPRTLSKPIPESGIVALLVYQHSDASKPPVLSLISGESSLKRVEKAVFDAAKSNKIPHMRWGNEELSEDQEIVMVINESPKKKKELVKKADSPSVKASPSLVKPPSRSSDIPFIDFEDSDKTRKGVEKPADEVLEGQLEPCCSTQAPSERLGSEDQKDSGLESMMSSNESAARSSGDGEQLRPLMRGASPGVRVETVEMLCFDVVHLPPISDHIGKFLRRCKADYYILPTGPKSQFTSYRAVEIHKNIVSGSRLVPTEHVVDSGWHDGHIRQVKVTDGLKRLYLVHQPVQAEQIEKKFAQRMMLYGVRLEKLIQRFDSQPARNQYEQPQIDVGGIQRDGIELPIWPQKLEVPGKILKIHIVKCDCCP